MLSASTFYQRQVLDGLIGATRHEGGAVSPSELLHHVSRAYDTITDALNGVDHRSEEQPYIPRTTSSCAIEYSVLCGSKSEAGLSRGGADAFIDVPMRGSTAAGVMAAQRRGAFTHPNVSSGTFHGEEGAPNLCSCHRNFRLTVTHNKYSKCVDCNGVMYGDKVNKSHSTHADNNNVSDLSLFDSEDMNQVSDIAAAYIYNGRKSYSENIAAKRRNENGTTNSVNVNAPLEDWFMSYKLSQAVGLKIPERHEKEKIYDTIDRADEIIELLQSVKELKFISQHEIQLKQTKDFSLFKSFQYFIRQIQSSSNDDMYPEDSDEEDGLIGKSDCIHFFDSLTKRSFYNTFFNSHFDQSSSHPLYLSPEMLQAAGFKWFCTEKIAYAYWNGFARAIRLKSESCSIRCYGPLFHVHSSHLHNYLNEFWDIWKMK